MKLKEKFEQQFYQKPIKKIEQFEQEPKKETGLKELEVFLAKTAENLNKKGLPLTSDCRINPAAFERIMDKKIIQADMTWVQNQIEKEKKVNTQLQFEKTGDQKEKIGFQLEMLKTALFNKYLSQELTTIRSSLYDDRKHHIDNLILDKQGNIICTVDAVSDMSGKDYEKKKEQIININRSGGTEIKYGAIFELQKQSYILKNNIKNVPLLYLCLKPEIIKRTIKNFRADTPSEEEKKLVSFFLAQINLLINEIKNKPIVYDIKQKLAQFQSLIKKFSPPNLK